MSAAGVFRLGVVAMDTMPAAAATASAVAVTAAGVSRPIGVLEAVGEAPSCSCVRRRVGAVGGEASIAPATATDKTVFKRRVLPRVRLSWQVS